MGQCPDAVKRLVDRFTQQADDLRSPDYNETLIRIDFINPLMTELGWDIDNRQGFAEHLREVVHEDRVKVAGQTKAPDYSFRAGAQRKFFLEAKKPAIDIRNNWEPAYQLRRYAWSAKLACSLLTDFEELAIYDARIQPKQLEKPSVARREYIRYTEYESRWDFIEGTFSKRAVWNGDFDRYCETKKGRGAQPFDDAFLSEIEEWRKSIATSLARNNEALDEGSLNFAVQRIIDRIIFLRMAEDRGTESLGQLQALLNGDDTYAKLCALFRAADARYNSGLFHFEKEKDRDESPDTLTPRLTVDDRTLKGIIKGLYYPQSPYEFTMVSADILGSVYERFLGKVITLTASHAAKVEEKPEVRKAGGVYYTPKYIVDYIVQNTVGTLLGATPSPGTPGEGGGEGLRAKDAVTDSAATAPKPSPQPSPGVPGEGVKLLTPKQASKLKILDPACGSGSFLIGAYQFLLDWYLAQYTASADPAALATGKNAVLRTAAVKCAESPADGRIIPGWALTIAERKRILLDHIHGVDLDGQAVEVTKLNLLLKCLEGETSHTLGFEGRLFRERALPDLGNNIKCGNSLIGTDIIGTEAWNAMSEEERARVNPFDYERGFPNVFKQGGFDAVIGNPPYVRVQRLEHADIDYIFTHYKTPASKTDLSQIFLERSLDIVNEKGRAAFICTSQWIATDYGEKMRGYLASEGRIHSVVDFGSLPVFEGVSTYPAIYVLSRQRASQFEVTKVVDADELSLAGIVRAKRRLIRMETLSSEPWNFAEFDLVHKLRGSATIDSKPLSAYGHAYIGTLTGMDEAFVVTNEVAKAKAIEDDVTFPYAYRGEEVFRFQVTRPGSRVIYPYTASPEGTPELIPEVDFERKYPSAYRHLREHRDRLRERLDSRKKYATGDRWYRHLRAGSFEYLRPAKLLIKGIDRRLVVGLLEENTIFNGANCPGFVMECNPSALNPLLGVLNSRLLSYHMRVVCPPKLSGYIRFNATNINEAPIALGEKPQQTRLTSLVDSMLSLHKRLAAEQLPQKREQLQREIDATDRQIDQLVYQLYGLTDEEIAIVEAATA